MTCAANAGPSRCLQAGGDECGLLASFGDEEGVGTSTREIKKLPPQSRRGIHGPLTDRNTGQDLYITPFHQMWPRAHLIRARCHLIQAEPSFHYQLLSAEIDDVIKQNAGCNQVATNSYMGYVQDTCKNRS
jgi:hypothetical protein